jgi:hypothetical protein
MQFLGDAPQIVRAVAADRDDNGQIGAGDELILTLSRSAEVNLQVIQQSHFFLPVQGDTLGGPGFAVRANPRNARQLALTLGEGARLRVNGAFSTSSLTANSPSAVDFASSLPLGAIASLDGVSAIDSGLPRVDDTGIDIQFMLAARQTVIGPAGGVLSIAPSADAVYDRHALVIYPGSVQTTTTFRLSPAFETFGFPNAFKIESNGSSLPLSPSPTVWVQYRPSDIDRERGLIEGEMHVFAWLPTSPPSIRFDPIATGRRLRPDLGLIGADVPLGPVLRPVSPVPLANGSLETLGVFAGLPIETVDERTVNIRPNGGGAVVKGAEGYVLTPGPAGAYTLHQIEFSGYQSTTAIDPQRLVVTIRTALLAEKMSTTGGDSFPDQSGAVFVVEIENASGTPVEFTDPVNITVQYKAREDVSLTDVVRLSGWPSIPGAMSVARDTASGADVDFALLDGPFSVDTAQGTVTATNVTSLTGADGMGTWGTVAREALTPAGRWRMYR